MKRILRKHWDETNGCLSVDYFRVSGDTLILIPMRSPCGLKKPEEAKGMIRRVVNQHGVKVTYWFTKKQAEELLSVFKEANNGKENDSRRSKKFR